MIGFFANRLDTVIGCVFFTLGVALLGKKKGEVVEVAAPNGTFQYKILEVVKSKKSRKKKEDK